METTHFKYFSVINIKEKRSISYDEIIQLVNSLRQNINEDELYDELILLNDVLFKLDETFFENMSVDQIWVKIFNVSNFLQLFQIISKVLSIPVSKAWITR